MPIQFTFTSKCILKNYNLNSIHVKPSTKKELLKKKKRNICCCFPPWTCGDCKMSTWECWLFRSIWFNMYVQKHVQVIYVMHTCEMFFHALVCMHWACFGSITLAFSLVCAPAMHMCCKLVPIHLCVSLTCVVAIYLSGVYLCQLTSA